MNNDSLRAKAVAEICGFGSVAMIDYLERSAIFIPERKREKNRGRPRTYTFRDVLVLRLLSTLLKNGASVYVLKEALSQLQKFRWKAEEAVLEDSSGALRHLILSAGRAYFIRENNELVDILSSGQLTFSFVLDLDQLHSTVQNEWKQSRIKLTA